MTEHHNATHIMSAAVDAEQRRIAGNDHLRETIANLQQQLATATADLEAVRQVETPMRNRLDTLEAEDRTTRDGATHTVFYLRDYPRIIADSIVALGRALAAQEGR